MDGKEVREKEDKSVKGIIEKGASDEDTKTVFHC
jgi:hypothetical protein